MSIKEFCLVPRSDIEAKRNPYQPIPQVSLPHERKTSQNESSIDDAINILLKPTDLQYADGIISYLRKQPIVRWDSSGSILSPVRGMKLVDVIRYLVTPNGTFDSSKIPDLRMMLKLVDLPKAYVRNNKAKIHLYKDETLPSTKVKQKEKIKWDPY